MTLGIATKKTRAQITSEIQHKFRGDIIPQYLARATDDALVSYMRVMETELESLVALEKRMQEYGSNPKMKEKMSGYTDMYLTGEREIYQLLE